MTQISANWLEYPAGLELDRLIAERLGWKIVAYKDLPNGMAYMGDIHSAALFDGLGHRIANCTHFKSFEGNAAHLWNNSTPKYSTDLNAAWSLMFNAAFSQHDGHFKYKVTIETDWRALSSALIVDVGGAVYLGVGDTDHDISLAICRAWLSWSDAHPQTEGDQ